MPPAARGAAMTYEPRRVPALTGMGSLSAFLDARGTPPSPNAPGAPPPGAAARLASLAGRSSGLSRARAARLALRQAQDDALRQAQDDALRQAQDDPEQRRRVE